MLFRDVLALLDTATAATPIETAGDAREGEASMTHREHKTEAGSVSR